ncbi:electron transport complex subunit E [Permianibacter sp. IMCC34836]|uniref:electron transport complex subunit E n=1 Tax=Permianibacter fluminis TaxID=2738515 RepID=UPI00155640F6|nr:electron transport complex subunit E [Permianibacter fluminis]NQD37216.1 electron transport complex subunit E [Permianibacter fluminis]
MTDSTPHSPSKRWQSALWQPELWQSGLWTNNPALVQVLGLCPLLAVSNTAINGLGLGLATLLVLVGANLLVSLVRHWIPAAIRIPVFVLLIGSLVTCIELLMHAWTYSLYQALGIFIPLIVTNCVIIGRAESFASRQPAHRAVIDGLAQGLGFTGVLFVLGSVREILGSGHWMFGAEQVFGSVGAALSSKFAELQQPMLLALLPPGAFLGLGGLIALKNVIDQRRRSRQAASATSMRPAAPVNVSNESRSANET